MSTKLWKMRQVLALAEHNSFTCNNIWKVVLARIVAATLALMDMIVSGPMFGSSCARAPAPIGRALIIAGPSSSKRGTLHCKRRT